jgi:hypothetical protein
VGLPPGRVRLAWIGRVQLQNELVQSTGLIDYVESEHRPCDAAEELLGSDES